MGYLFLVTNTADNNKSFVGYTTRILAQVRASYFTQAKLNGNNPGSALFEAIRKFKRPDFRWTKISEDITNLEELKRRRIVAINEHGTADPEKGYNIRDGISVDPTINSKKPPKYFCVETGELFASTYEIQATIGLARQTVGRMIKLGASIKGKTFRRLVPSHIE